MAITNVAAVGTQGPQCSNKPVFIDRVDLDLDASYPTGGYTTISTTIKAVIGANKTIIAIQQASPCGGYKLFWDRTNDKLMAYQGAAGLGADSEVSNATNLSTITNCEFIVISI